MILAPNLFPGRKGTLPRIVATGPAIAMPDQLRSEIPDAQSLAEHGVADVALVAGAAIGALDALVRRQERWAGAWRQRLALAAAAVTAQRGGRIEDEAALRDAVLLTRPGDDVGPAGRMLLGWRRLASRPAADLLTRVSLSALLEEFGHAPDAEMVSDLADELQQLSGSEGTVGMLTGALAAAERHGFGRAVGAWFVDALLARRLGWSHAVPLLGTEATVSTSSRRRSTAGAAATGMETDTQRVKDLLTAQARAALRAADLSVELARRADLLLAVAPKLRAKAAGAVVERILSDDAITASERIAGISDRGLRRLFDRLVALGAVRELTDRPTFRIYGL